MDDEDWLRREYASAYRTACLVLLDPQDAAEIVQSAFLRVWTFRDALPAAATRRGWLYRVVVRACTTGPHAHRTTRGQHRAARRAGRPARGPSRGTGAALRRRSVGRGDRRRRPSPPSSCRQAPGRGPAALGSRPAARPRGHRSRPSPGGHPMRTLLSDDTLTSLFAMEADSVEVPSDGPDRVLARVADAPAPWWQSRRRRAQLAAATAAVVAVVLVLPGLFGGAGRSSELVSGAGPTSSLLRGPAASRAAGAAGSATTADARAQAPGRVSRSGPAGAAPAGGATSAGTPGNDGAATRVVKTGSIALVVDKGQVTPVLTTVQTVSPPCRGMSRRAPRRSSGRRRPGR